MTYPEAIQYLYSLRWFGAKFGLENTRKLAELSGNPHQRLRFIHVAGTNGKGSTCAMLESIYRAAGLRVGLFTSPHLVSFGERIQVNRQLIAQSEIVQLIQEMQPLLKQFDPSHHPTFFEVVMVMALRHFLAQKCDLVIWETGLGGRLDATNIVTPLASVITNIQYDHQEWLGDTLAEIAAEKAGIIKPDIPVITASDDAEALRVIENVARAHNAPLTVVTASEIQRPALSNLRLPLLGRHQQLNAALAAAVVSVLAHQISASDDALRAGLSNVQWPGRLQLITQSPGHEILLDGAHNIAGARILATALNEYFPEGGRALILGMLEDKDWAGMCEILAPMARRILLVPVPSERSAAPKVLADACRRANPRADVLECASMADALASSATDRFIVVAGSLYLVGEAIELLKVSPSAHAQERCLNEWSVKA